MSTTRLSPVSILTEDWYNGYTPRDDYYVPDGEDEVLDAYREFDSGYSYDEANDLPLVLRDTVESDRATLAYLHRDEEDSSILKRWNQPEDVLNELEAIESDDDRAIWIERMTAFRQVKLHKLLIEYFGTKDYMDREIVLRWESKNGRWIPAEKMVVSAWIESKIEEKGTRLAGFASCGGTLQRKLTKRATKRTGVETWWKK